MVAQRTRYQNRSNDADLPPFTLLSMSGHSRASTRRPREKWKAGFTQRPRGEARVRLGAWGPNASLVGHPSIPSARSRLTSAGTGASERTESSPEHRRSDCHCSTRWRPVGAWVRIDFGLPFASLLSFWFPAPFAGGVRFSPGAR